MAETLLHPLQKRIAHTIIQTPNLTHHENHFWILFLSKRTWQFFWDRLWKVNFCAGIFQHHFIFSPPLEPRKKEEKNERKTVLWSFSMSTKKGRWRERESFHCWWQLRSGGMSKMSGERERWLNMNTNTRNQLLFFNMKN